MRRLFAALLVALGAVSAMEIEAAQARAVPTQARAACVYLMPDAAHRTGWQALQVLYWLFYDRDSQVGRWITKYAEPRGWAAKSSPVRNARPDTIIYYPDLQGRDDAYHCRKFN